MGAGAQSDILAGADVEKDKRKERGQSVESPTAHKQNAATTTAESEIKAKIKRAQSYGLKISPKSSSVR